MRIPTSLRTAVALLALICLTVPLASTAPVALDAQETQAQPTTPETAPEKTRAKPRGRVPNHYGWLVI